MLLIVAIATQATNNTDYLLLASNDVSIFFDNSFVTKTSLTSVSPGESFQTFLGIDPAVKVLANETETSHVSRNISHLFSSVRGCFDVGALSLISTFSCTLAFGFSFLVP